MFAPSVEDILFYFTRSKSVTYKVPQFNFDHPTNFIPPDLLYPPPPLTSNRRGTKRVTSGARIIIFWRVNSNLLQNPHSFGQYVSITDFAFLQKSDFAQDLHIPLFASRSLSLHSTMQKKNESNAVTHFTAKLN